MVVVDARNVDEGIGGGKHSKTTSEAPPFSDEKSNRDKKKKNKKKSKDNKKKEKREDESNLSKKRARVPVAGAGRNADADAEAKKISIKKRRMVTSHTLEEFENDPAKWLKAILEGLSEGKAYLTERRLHESDFLKPMSMSNALIEIKAQLMKSSENKVLIVTRSAVRACELIKDLSILRKPAAKLFRKAGSVEDQAKFLSDRKRSLSIAVGVPSRIQKVAELESSLDAFLASPNCIIMLDVTLDAKNFHLFSLPDVCTDACQFLQKSWLTKPQTTSSKLLIAT